MLDSTKFVKWFKKHDNIAGYVILFFLSAIFAGVYDYVNGETRNARDKIISLRSDLESKNNSIDYYKKGLNNNWKRLDDYKKYIQEYELEKKELINNLNSHMKNKDFYDSLKTILFFIWLLSCLFYLIIRPLFIIKLLDKTKEWTNLYYDLLNTINKENKHFNKDSKCFIVFERSYEKKYSEYEKTNTYLFLNVFYIHINEQDLIFQKFQLNFESMTTLEIEKFSWPRNLLKSINQNHFENYIVNLDTNQKHSFEYFSNLILENKLGPSVIMPIFNPLTEQELYDYSKLLMKHE